VSSATGEQKKSGEQVVLALDNISQMAVDLTRQSQNLLDAIAFFKDDASQASKPAPREITLHVEAAKPSLVGQHGHR
jgi:DNA anti-recombination protein RmuC